MGIILEVPISALLKQLHGKSNEDFGDLTCTYKSNINLNLPNRTCRNAHCMQNRVRLTMGNKIIPNIFIVAAIFLSFSVENRVQKRDA